MKKIFIKATSLLLAAGISLSVSSSASAYSLWGWELEQPQIKYYYDNWVASEAKTAALAGVKAWQRAVSSVELSINQGTLVSFADTNQPEADWDGLCSIDNVPGTNYITQALITFNSATSTWNNASALQSVAVHELGHAMGLADLSGTSKAIMNGFTPQRYGVFKLTTPQPDDINGVNYLYG